MKQLLKIFLMISLTVVTLFLLGRFWDDAEGSTAVFSLNEMRERENGIPALYIYLNDVTLEEIHNGSRRVKYNDNVVVLLNGGEMTEYIDVQIKGRGNSTWWDSIKKPYQLKFAGSKDLFDTGEAQKWVLLANYKDVSHLRNEAAFLLADEMGMLASAKGEFVELYIQEEYCGLYYMIPKVEVGTDSVCLEEDNGILVEIENAHETAELYARAEYDESVLILKDSVTNDEERSRMALEEFKNAFDRFEEAAIAGDWEMITEIIDVESFAKYLLISEFTANPDSYASSFFMYRDGEKDRIHAGPMWDFDVAFANDEWTYGDAKSTSRSWIYTDPRELGSTQAGNGTQIFQWLMDIPEFRICVEDIYRTQMEPVLSNLVNKLGIQALKIEEYAVRDLDKWRTDKDYALEKEHLLAWISGRIDYMDSFYGNRMIISDGYYEIKYGEQVLTVKVEACSDGSYVIRDYESDLVLGIKDSSLETGAAVCFLPYDNSNHQKWILVNYGNKEIFMMSKQTGLALRMADEMTAEELDFDNISPFSVSLNVVEK